MRDLDTLAAHARKRLGVMNTKDLHHLGFTDSAIRANLDAGRWQRVHPAVYVMHTGPLAWPVRAWAALEYVGMPALLSHDSAAYLRGWDTAAPEVIDVTVPYARRSAPQPTVRTHRSRAFLHIADDVLPPRTTAARTVSDLLRGQTTEAAAQAFILESVRRRWTSGDRLRRELEPDRRHPWRLLGMKTAELAAGGIQSELERLYLEIESAHGLPKGRRQRKVSRLSSDEFQDVYYDDYGFAVELDGRLGHESVTGQLRDRRRDNRNTLAGQPTLRFGYLDCAQSGCLVARDVETLLRSGGWRGPFLLCPHCEC